MLNYLYCCYEELSRGGVMLCFLGPTSQSVVEGIGSALKREMELENVGRGQMHQIFSIFIEQIQNIARYSLDNGNSGSKTSDELKYGVVVVGRENEKYYVICGNKTNTTQGQKLVERIKQLQQLNRQDLNELYKRMRREPPDEDSQGAGLGLVEMCRRASEPLQCRVIPLDDDMVFFTIKATG